MSEYLPSFIVDPVLRQARRLSRISTGEESPNFVPQLPDFQRWNPTRYWATSPPPSIDEEEPKETTFQSITRTIQLWANQINDLDIDPMPSPPLDVVAERHPEPGQNTIEFPPLETQPEPRPIERPIRLEDHRTDSETSLNPARELETRSRALADASRGHSQSDPAAAVHVDITSLQNEYTTDGYVRRRDGSDTLPEDDGMGALRQRINAIWAGEGTSAEKSRLIHVLMMERYRNAQRISRAQVHSPLRPASPSVMSTVSQETVFNLTQSDLTPTYAPLDVEDLEDQNEDSQPPKPQLGCIHYRRNVKMQCNTCAHWHTCRLCHDEAENHTLPRRETKYMLCMLCNTPQTASQICRMCGETAAHYYCPICKLWNDDPRKQVYHCDDCGICRLGAGLGKDFFHCKTCAACMSITAEETHRCVERSTKSDCPICGEYMFTSNKPVAFMKCGHSIHESCFAEWCLTSYKCPMCSKSVTNMESQFRRLDRHIDEQPMPEEYRAHRAYVFCNDCNSRSVTKYHWLGLKCALCESYNTTQLELMGGAEQTPQLEQQAQAVHICGAGEAGITASQSQGHTPTEDLTPATTHPPTLPSIEARSPSVGSPWLLPHSPTGRSARSVSPVVGSYFGTASPQPSSVPIPRRGTPLEDDDDMDFWGTQSPRSQDAIPVQQGDSDDESGSSGSSSDSDVDAMEEDEPEEEDAMDIFGHR